MTARVSICIPTYQRPDGLAAALASVVASTPADRRREVEIVVCDNGGSNPAVDVAAQHLRRWPGPTRHVVHPSSVGMVGNFNACWEAATGEWVLILHDDDYLTHAGVAGLLRAACDASPGEDVLLLGVEVVDEHGHRRHRQVASRRRYLKPGSAVRWLVSDSSSVRFPAMLVRRSAYARLGGFDPGMAHITDYDMWLRLFRAHGVTLIPEITAAYVVHSQAATEALFSEFGIDLLHELFRRVDATGLIGARRLHTLKRDYFHKFLLAGTIRRLRAHQWDEARKAFALLQTEGVATLGWSPRWALLRGAARGVLTLTSVYARGRTVVHS